MPFLILLALIQFYRLRQFPDPSGADGYFYIKQIQSLSELGQFYYKDYSLAFFPPVLLNLILRNALLSYQVWTSALLALIPFALRHLLKSMKANISISQKIFCTALLTALIFNPFYLQLDLVFLKTATALLCFIYFLSYLQISHRLKAALFALASILTHKIFIIFVLLAAILYFTNRTSRWNLKVVSGGLTGIFGFLALSLAIHPVFIGQFFHSAAQTNYAKFSFLAWGQSRLTLVTLGVLLLTSIFSFYLSRYVFPSLKWICLLMGLILLSPVIFPDALNSSSVSFRLIIISIPLGFLILAFAISQAANIGVLAKWAAVFVILSTFFIQRPLDFYIPAWSKKIPDVRSLDVLPEGVLLYAPHGVEFYLAYKTHFRPRSFLVDAKGRAIYRVALVGPYLTEDGALKDDISHLSVAPLGPDYRIFLENDWRNLEALHQMMPLSANMLVAKPDFIADY